MGFNLEAEPRSKRIFCSLTVELSGDMLSVSFIGRVFILAEYPNQALTPKLL